MALATEELADIGLVDAADVEAGYVVRMPKAYPVYDDVLPGQRRGASGGGSKRHAPNVHPVGRNGMHKYNNQDHSMYTAMLTVENIHGADHDIWSVNVEEEYHEDDDAKDGAGPGPAGPDRPGRARRSAPCGHRSGDAAARVESRPGVPETLSGVGGVSRQPGPEHAPGIGPRTSPVWTSILEEIEPSSNP